ncbi:putative CPA1 family monovalent cation:H+ antiporter [Seiridium cardinale]|uniref:CPA1 family monovalent cation:H+ antiporter n=1 Tax=Seiridium cardinale TaxID=138064 RepID=A0ABR2X5R4_9PEZI
MAKRSQIPELEPDGPHLMYLSLSFFLVLYALFSELIRNKLHLSEPPLATLTGIALGPLAADLPGPSKWASQDNITQELARVVTCVQVFAVGLDLPSGYVRKHWKGLAVLLGPNMIFGWLASTVILKLVIGVQWSTAFIIAATLTPTDPVLSASVLGEAKFSTRIPKRIRYILGAESGCNDGTAYPFLYAAVFAVIESSKAEWSKMFFLETILWQCVFGIFVGAVIGLGANKALRFSEARGYTQDATLFVFYFLLAILATGVGSTLGLDDFLVSFTAGTAFCWDGWFHEKTHKMKLPSIIDLLLNSTMFVYFGTIIPWDKFVGTGNLNAWRLLACTVLILLFRRLPSILALHKLLPETRTWSEAILVGHFGPMGVGAMFLAMEARGRLETGSSTPEPHPPADGPHAEAVLHLWPVVSFIVLGSIMVHGFSAALMSVYGHLTRHPKRRAAAVGGEEERLAGMASEEDGSAEDSPGLSSSGDEAENETIGHGQISIR